MIFPHDELTQLKELSVTCCVDDHANAIASRAANLCGTGAELRHENTMVWELFGVDAI